MKMGICDGDFPAELLVQLATDEARLVQELTGRGDTVSLTVTDGARLVGYAVMGWDDADMVTVYAARSLNHFLARAAMMGIFGAAQIMGAPLRVHTEKLRAMARMLGAEKALAALDGDRVPMGVFDGLAV